MPATGNIISIKSLCVLGLLALVSACATSNKRLPKGDFIKPIATKEITSRFGPRRGRPHYGVDYGAPRGTPIMASEDGKVVFAGRQNGFGRIVIIQHDRAVQTYYAHMDGFAVGTGKRVRRGDIIGYVGSSGNATGPHLHFEIRNNGRPIDPLLVLNR